MLKTISILAIAGLVLALAPAAQAEFIAGTGFENESAPGTHFTNYDHGNTYPAKETLNNSSGQTLIESTSASTAAGDLGFVAEYERVSTLEGSIFTENYEVFDPTGAPCVGIVDRMYYGPNSIGAFFTESSNTNPSNTQGYKASQVWGILRLTFDPVDLSGYDTVTCSMDAYFRTTGWEWNSTTTMDHLTIYMVTNEGVVTLFDTSGSDIDTQSLEGKWSNGLSVQLADTVTAATLVIEFGDDSQAEQMYIDNIAFEGTAIPEPATMSLLAIGGIALIRRRRRA